MLQKNHKYALFLLCLLPAIDLLSQRRSHKRKIERIEMRKKVVITDDQELSMAVNKQTKHMNFKEALLAKGYYAKEKDNAMVIKCAQRAIAVGGDQKNDQRKNQEIIQNLRFELIELFMTSRNYKEVEKYATEYQKLYPGAENTIKAEYRAIEAHFNMSLPSDREQVKTQKTIELAQEFLERHTEPEELVTSVKKMLHESYQTLIRSEINIIMTQLNAFNHTKNPANLDAAHKRLDHIKENYLAHAPASRKKLTEIELALAQAAGKTELAKDKRAELAQFPVKKIVVAQNKKPYTFVEIMKHTLADDNETYFA